VLATDESSCTRPLSAISERVWNALAQFESGNLGHCAHFRRLGYSRLIVRMESAPRSTEIGTAMISIGQAHRENSRSANLRMRDRVARDKPSSPCRPSDATGVRDSECSAAAVHKTNSQSPSEVGITVEGRDNPAPTTILIKMNCGNVVARLRLIRAEERLRSLRRPLFLRASILSSIPGRRLVRLAPAAKRRPRHPSIDNSRRRPPSVGL